MRIVLIGQAAFGEAVLKKLLERGEEVVGVYTPPDAPGGRPDPLKALAESSGIPVFQPKRLRAPEVFPVYAALAPELNIMAFVTDIVPETILNFPRYGTFQYHPSLLPKHRGASSMNWPIIQGETKTGLSIFWPDKGLDTGPILLQKEVIIEPHDTLGSLYFGKLFPMGVEALMEALDLVKEGKAPRIPQDHSQATYEPPCREEHGVIDWARPVTEVYNLIRGCNPQPGASTLLQGQKIKIFDSVIWPERVDGRPGEVAYITDDGFVAVAGGGGIHVKRVQPPASGKIAALEFVKAAGLKEGDRLGV